MYGGQDNRLVYAVFTTPKNSISASALCAFRLRDLLDTFEGAFKEQGRTHGLSFRILLSFFIRDYPEMRCLIGSEGNNN